MIRTDLGLIASGLRALEDVRLPAESEHRQALAQQLEPGKPHFEAALKCGESAGAHGEYCLGVCHLANGGAERAAPLLERAVAEMQRRSNVYDRSGILSRARLYLAYALAQSLDPSRCADIVRLFKQSVFRIGLPHDEILREILIAVATMSADEAKALAEHLQDQYPDLLVNALGDAELLRHVPEARRALLERGDSPTRSSSERFDDYARVFNSACRASDGEMAEDALDRMEGLATCESSADRFLTVLGTVDEHTTIWSADEIDFARLRVLEQLGHTEQARTVLNRVGHRWISLQDDFYAPEAAELVARIRLLGVDPSETLERRVASLTPIQETKPSTSLAGTVFFIGGDERQARYDKGLQDWVRKQWPAVQLEVEHPGWGSNWHRQFDGWRTRLDRTDVVVLMPYVRTNLGRHCRRKCGELEIPWVPCTSTGEAGMRRAIGRAIALLT